MGDATTEQPETMDGFLGGKLPVVGPNGKFEAVSRDEYAAKVAEGYRPQTEEEQGKFYTQIKYDSPIKAGLAGAARALTLGASDAFLPAADIVDADTLKGLKEANPVADTVGEVGGTIASMVVPGVNEVSGPALATKVGLAAEHGIEATSVLGRIGAKVLGGAVTGSLFGAGNAVSEAALGDTDLTAQKLFAHGGLGAVLGGAGGGIGGLLGEAVAPIAKKLSAALEEAPEKLEDIANTRTAKAIGGIQSDFNKLTQEKVQQVAQDVREAGYAPAGSNAREILGRVKQGAKEQWKIIENSIASADEAAPGGFNLRSVVERGRKELLEPIEGSPALKADAKKLASLLDGYDEMTAKEGGVSFAEAQKENHYLRIGLKKQDASIAEKDAVAKLQNIFRDELGSQIKATAGDEIGATFEDAMQKYGSFAEAKKWGIKGIRRMEGNRNISLTDTMTGIGAGLLHGGPVGVAVGMASSLAHKLMRERGSSVVASIAEKVAESPILAHVAEGFSKAAANPQSLKLFGNYEPILANAIAKGPATALATHLALSKQDPAYVDASSLAGFPAEDPGQTGQLLQKAHALAGLQRLVEDHDDDTDRHIGRILDGNKSPVGHLKALATQDYGGKRMKRQASTAFEKRTDEVHELAANPQAIVDRVASNLGSLGSHAPGVSAAASATAVRAVDYLASKSKQMGSQAPLAAKWTPNATEVANFHRQLEAVQNPQSVLKHAASGTLTPQHMEALRTVYPQYAAHIAQKVAEHLTDQPKGVPYRQRVMLSLLSGVDADGTMSPGFLQRNQQTYQAPSSKSPVDQTVKPTSKGAGSLTLSSRLQTPQQQATDRTD